MTGTPEPVENPFANWTNQAIHSELTKLVNLARSKKSEGANPEFVMRLHSELSPRRASKAPDGPQRWLNKSEFLSVWLMVLIHANRGQDGNTPHVCDGDGGNAGSETQSESHPENGAVRPTK